MTASSSREHLTNMDGAPEPPMHLPSRKKKIMTFDASDPQNPYNWPNWKKYSIIGPITLIDLSVSFAASGYSPASTSFTEDMGVSTEVGLLGLSLYVLGLAGGPMTLAPLSEYFGRNPIYIISYGIFLLFLAGTALVPNLGGFLVLRILSGFFASVTIANFGGTIADLYHAHDTGPMMSIFLWAATAGSPMGFFLLSCVAQYHGWRIVLWSLLGINGGFWVIMTIALLLCGETRHSVLLMRRVNAERKKLRIEGREAEAENIDLPEDMKKRGVKQLFKVALTRPFRFLATEAIIQFGALYNGYLYGLSFLFNGAFSIVFGDGHGFNTFQVGLSFLGIVFGITCGPITNIWQERHFQRKIKEAGGKNIPEARVQMGKVAAIVFPLSLFWFAWTTYSSIHPVVPILASAFWGWSFYTLILMTYTYTEDSYKQYSASALAGIGFIRNLAGGGFPLFGNQMFENLGNQKAGTLIAGLACVLVPIPFVLDKFGRSLRNRSPWAREHMDDLGEDEDGSSDSEDQP